MTTGPPTDTTGSTGGAGGGETNWAATRPSIGIVLGMTAILGWVLTNHIRGQIFVGVGLLGVLVLAGSFWLYSFERWQIPARVGGNLLVLPGGALIFGAGALLTAREFSARFPQPTASQIPQPALEIVSAVIVLAAILLAALGVIATVRPILTKRIVRRAFVEQVRMLTILVIVAAVVEYLYLQSRPDAAAATGVEATIEWQPVETLRTIFLVPEAEPNFFPVVLLLTGFLLTVRLALAVLPLRALLDHLLQDREQGLPNLRPLFTLLHWTIFLGGILGFFGFLVSLDRSSDLAFFAGAYPSIVQRLSTVAAAAGLRTALAFGSMAFFGVYVLTWLVKTLVRADSGVLVRRWTGFIVGALLASTPLVLRPTPEFFGLVELAVAQAPAAARPDLREVLREVITLVGPTPLLLSALTGVVGLSLLLTGVLGVALGFKYLPEQQAGPSLASGGLFLAIAFATTIGFPLSLTVAGLVGAFLVWDAGEYGNTLGREIGRLGYRSRIEIVHVLGTISIGVLAAGFALSIRQAIRGFATPDIAILPIALVGSTAGLLLLVLALR